jgi:hypothetical protein
MKAAPQNRRSVQQEAMMCAISHGVAWRAGLFDLKRSGAARRRLRVLVSGQKFIAFFDHRAKPRLHAFPLPV